MQVGRYYVIYAHIDEESYRIVATAKVDKYLSKDFPPYQAGDKVDIMIWQKSDLGFKAIIENKYSGLIYENEIFGQITTGMRMQAFIKQIREDGKIDLELQKAVARKVDDFSKTLHEFIEKEGGHISFTDKSDAEDIYATFGVSKKTFKKAVGDLYKKRIITIETNGISLVNV